MAAPAANEPPLATYAFAIEVDGVTVALFSEARGLEVELITHPVVSESGRRGTQQPGDPGHMWEIALGRSIDQGDTALIEWINEVADGRIERSRRDCSIVMFDPAGAEVARWDLLGAWPKSWTLGGGTERALIEEVVFGYTTMSRRQAG